MSSLTLWCNPIHLHDSPLSAWSHIQLFSTLWLWPVSSSTVPLSGILPSQRNPHFYWLTLSFLQCTVQWSPHKESLPLPPKLGQFSLQGSHKAMWPFTVAFTTVVTLYFGCASLMLVFYIRFSATWGWKLYVCVFFVLFCFCFCVFCGGGSCGGFFCLFVFFWRGCLPLYPHTDSIVPCK